MGIPDFVLQKDLEEIATCNQLDIVTDATDPVNGDLTNSIASVAVTPGDGNGSFVIADGAVSGRKLTLLEHQVPCTISGTGRWYALSLNGTIKFTEKAGDPTNGIQMDAGATYQCPQTDIMTVKDPA